MARRATPEAVQVLPCSADRDVWLRARRNGIGGSDASAVVGLNPYRSPFAVYLDKLGELPPSEPSEAAQWGTRLEPLIADWFAEQSGLRLRRAGLLANVDREWQLVTPDRLASDAGLVEIKATGNWLASEWEDDQVPDHAEIQVQHAMSVTGLGHAWVVGLIGGQRPVVRRVPRDERLIANLIRIEAEFWERVQQRRRPQVCASDRAVLTRSRHPKAGTETVVDAGVLRPLLVQLAAVRAARRDARRVEDEVCARIAALVGDAEYGSLAGRRAVQIRRATRNGIDIKRLRAERPTLAAGYATTTVYDQIVILEN